MTKGLRQIYLVSCSLLLLLIFSCQDVRGLCNEGFKIAIPNVCSLYLECEGGKFVEKECYVGKIFSDVVYECVALLRPDRKCHNECTFEGKKSIEGDDSRYVYCEGAKFKIGRCLNRFDSSTNQCDHDEYIDVGIMYFSENSSCIPGVKMAVEESCSEYMECSPEMQWIQTQCPECQNFDPSAKGCVWAWKYSCPSSGSTTQHPTSSSTTENPTSGSTSTKGSTTPPTSSTTSSTSTTAKTISSTTSSKPTTVPSKGSTRHTTPTSGYTTVTSSTPTTPNPECSPPGIMKPLKKGDCKNYLECDSGKWVQKSCPFGYDFDTTKNSCVWSWWAHC